MCVNCVCERDREMIVILNVAFDFVVLTETVYCVTWCILHRRIHGIHMNELQAVHAEQ